MPGRVVRSPGWSEIAVLAVMGVVVSYFYVFGAPSGRVLSREIFAGLGDPVSFLCIFDKFSSHLFHPSSHLFDGGILYPADKTLLFSESMPLSGLLYGLLHSVFSSKILAFNLLMLFFFSADFVAMAFFCRFFMGRACAIAAGCVFAFSLVRMAQNGHPHLFPQFFFPLTAAGIYLYETTGRRRYLIYAALAAAGQVYCSVMLGMLLLITLVPYPLLRLWRKQSRKAFALDAGCALVVLGALLAFLFIPYSRVSQAYHFTRSQQESRIYSAHITNYLLVPAGHPYSPILTSRKLQRALFAGWEKNLFVGFAVLFLVILRAFLPGASAPSRRSFWTWILVPTLIFVIWMSLGPQASLYSFFYHAMPGVSAIRTPARLGLSYLFFMALFAGLGLEALLHRLPRATASGGGVLLILGVLFVFENHMRIGFAPIPSALADASAYLKRRPGRDAVMHLPFQHENDVRWYFALSHGHPLANGYCGFVPWASSELGALAAGVEFFPDLLEDIRQRGVRYLVIEKTALGASSNERWRENRSKMHLLAVFDDPQTTIFDLRPPPSSPSRG